MKDYVYLAVLVTAMVATFVTVLPASFITKQVNFSSRPERYVLAMSLGFTMGFFNFYQLQPEVVPAFLAFINGFLGSLLGSYLAIKVVEGYKRIRKPQ